MIEELGKKLAARSKKTVVDADRTVAAVLIPCYVKDGEYHLLFIQRTDRVRDHKNQISFPGGAREPADVTLCDTALREAEEEIGVERGAVKIVGELDDMATAGTRYVITPFLGVVPYPYALKLDRFETEEIIEVPLSVLLDEKCMREGTAIVDGKPIDSYFYHCGQKVIWGATARILKQLLDIVSECVSEGASLETE